MAKINTYIANILISNGFREVEGKPLLYTCYAEGNRYYVDYRGSKRVCYGFTPFNEPIDIDEDEFFQQVRADIRQEELEIRALEVDQSNLVPTSEEIRQRLGE